MSKPFVPKPGAALVRYLVADIERTLAFYTESLGFQLVAQTGPVTTIARGDLHVMLSGRGASGWRPMPDGTQQAPGGWNRIVLYVDDLDATIASLEKVNARFRNQVETGPGGRQILLDDPDGNPIELHEAPRT
jgi:glyoxylase I family protein